MNSSQTISRRLIASILCVLGGIVSQTLSSQTILGIESSATNFFSHDLWQSLVGLLGGRLGRNESGGALAEVDFLPLFGVWTVIAAVGATLAARLIRQHHRSAWSDSFITAGFACGWWWLMGAWELARLAAFVVGWHSLGDLLFVTPQFWQATALAGWLVQPFATSASPRLRVSALPPPAPQSLTTFVSRHATLKSVIALIAIYIVVFTAMNWRLWQNLRIPHGDSAMYEEHLWNLWHGKGFRSYLDQGLFLGEHIQVIHLLLLPLHLIWPSQLLMELCESTALAIGAIPIFRMTQRSTGSARAGLLMSAAYLLYFPLHFLDIEVDLKTFRPESFCVPFFLFAFEALELGRLRRALILLAIALSAKEDYSIIIAPLGVWMAATAWFQKRAVTSPLPPGEGGRRPGEGRTTTDTQSQLAISSNPTAAATITSNLNSVPHPGPLPKGEGESAAHRQMIVGLCLAVFGVAYLLLATRVVIPWFRGGAELHYVKYFSKFGDSMGEVAKNMLTNPSLVLEELLTARTALYALSMLLPVGFIALLSPGRLAVGLPLFGILCLNELAADPRHHFHAPLVPVVFWATSIGVANAGKFFSKLKLLISPSPHLPLAPSPDLPISPSQPIDSFARQFVWASSFTTALFLSMSPAGITFWDAGSSLSLWRLYALDARADHFPKVLEKIPADKRVASTDYVHPRFTHHARSYDYSHYRRKIAGYEDRVPEDTDFIVIDTRHPYSDLKSPNQVRELQTEPDRWELIPDDTDGYFIVLQRRK